MDTVKNYATGTDAALQFVMEGHNTFITGPGGSGKSHLIETIRTFLGDTTVFVAPTGVAALNIRGVSCHRAFGLSTGISQEKDFSRVYSDKQAKLMSAKELERVVIDEVSMVRSDKFYEIDQKLRHFRKTDKPFGGLQVIVVGDGFQIAPVLGRNEEYLFREMYGSEIPFGCWSWHECNFRNVMLTKGYRQADAEFLKHLNYLRLGINRSKVVDYMNTNCYNPQINPDAITLTNTNKLADEINNAQFKTLPGASKVYKALIKGDFKDYPVPASMELKVDMKVMVIANEPSVKPGQEPKYVNGSIGFIRKLGTDSVDVEINGSIVRVFMNAWENIAYEVKEHTVDSVDKEGNPCKKTVKKITEKVMGSFTALPLKIGYAVTTHKTQGLTLDPVNINLGYGAFAAGQAYVAISRAANKERLRLLKPLREKDIIVDQRIVDFYRHTFPGL